jgi:hypothetical protein
MDHFDTTLQADEFEDPFDDDGDFEHYYFVAEDDDYPDDDRDDFPMYLEYEGPFGLSGYDEY